MHRNEDVTALYQRAEQALEQCIDRATEGCPIGLHPDEAQVLKQVQSRYDRELLRVQTRTFLAAQERAAKLVAINKSAIPKC